MIADNNNPIPCPDQKELQRQIADLRCQLVFLDALAADLARVNEQLLARLLALQEDGRVPASDRSSQTTAGGRSASSPHHPFAPC